MSKIILYNEKKKKKFKDKTYFTCKKPINFFI